MSESAVSKTKAVSARPANKNEPAPSKVVECPSTVFEDTQETIQSQMSFTQQKKSLKPSKEQSNAQLEQSQLVLRLENENQMLKSEMELNQIVLLNAADVVKVITAFFIAAFKEIEERGFNLRSLSTVKVVL